MKLPFFTYRLFWHLENFWGKSSEEDDDPWNSYFPIQFTGNPIKNRQNCNLETNNHQYFLDECNFFDDNNRVIYFYPIENSLFLHNRCSFSNCISKEDGTCIYYVIGSNSSIVQRKFCCTKCQSSKSGQFSYTEVDTDNLNFFIESSLFDVGSESVGGNTFRAISDNIVVSSTNYSSCKAPNQPVGLFQCPSPVSYTHLTLPTTERV